MIDMLKINFFQLLTLLNRLVVQLAVSKNILLKKAVVISTDEYERVKKLEERYELAKHTEIYNIVQERKKIPIS